MKENKTLNTIKEIIFIFIFTLSCLTTNSDNLKGYFGSKGTLLIIANYICIIAFVAIATFINKNNIIKISKISGYIVLITTVLLIFDYYVTHFSGSQFLFRVWWIGSIFIAQASLFLTITIIRPYKYDEICKWFWICFTPLYLFLMYLCFIRTPFSDYYSTNFVLGNGTFEMLKAFIRNPKIDFEAPLIFFGNLFVFVPLPFLIKSFFKSINNRWLLTIGGIIPVLIESYQLVFKCGNADIDDLVVNWAGFLIGYILYIVINAGIKKKINIKKD